MPRTKDRRDAHALRAMYIETPNQKPKADKIMDTIYTTTKVRLKVCDSPRAKVQDPESTVKLLRAILADLDADQEHFIILTLNKSNLVTGFKVCFTGGQSETGIYTNVVYRHALLMGASAIILCHNHPSGCKHPSPEDIRVTKKLSEAGSIIGIKVLDHIIIAGDEYASFKEMSLI